MFIFFSFFKAYLLFHLSRSQSRPKKKPEPVPVKNGPAPQHWQLYTSPSDSLDTGIFLFRGSNWLWVSHKNKINFFNCPPFIFILQDMCLCLQITGASNLIQQISDPYPKWNKLGSASATLVSLLDLV